MSTIGQVKCPEEHEHKCVYWKVKGHDRLYMEDVGKKFIRTVPIDNNFYGIPAESTDEAIEKVAYLFTKTAQNEFILMQEGNSNPIHVRNWGYDYGWIEVETFKRNLQQMQAICIGPVPLPASTKKLDANDIGHLVIRLTPDYTGDQSYMAYSPFISDLLRSAVCVTKITQDGVFIQKDPGHSSYPLPDAMNDSRWIRVEHVMRHSYLTMFANAK